MPNHNGPTITAIIEEEIVESVRGVIDVKTSMSLVVEKLKEHGFLEGIHDNYVVCDLDPDSCDVSKGYVQNLMNKGMVQFSRSKVVEEISVIEPITIIYRKRSSKLLPRGSSLSIYVFLVHFHIKTPRGFL